MSWVTRRCREVLSRQRACYTELNFENLSRLVSYVLRNRRQSVGIEADFKRAIRTIGVPLGQNRGYEAALADFFRQKRRI